MTNRRFRLAAWQSGLSEQQVHQSHQFPRGVRIAGPTGDTRKHPGKVYDICHSAASSMRPLAA
jgi:hypothetical protein